MFLPLYPPMPYLPVDHCCCTPIVLGLMITFLTLMFLPEMLVFVKVSFISLIKNTKKLSSTEFRPNHHQSSRACFSRGHWLYRELLETKPGRACLSRVCLLKVTPANMYRRVWRVGERKMITTSLQGLYKVGCKNCAWSIACSQPHKVNIYPERLCQLGPELHAYHNYFISR